MAPRIFCCFLAPHPKERRVCHSSLHTPVPDADCWEQAEAKRKAALAAKPPGGGDFHVDKRNKIGGGRGGRKRGGRGRFGRRGRVV